MESMIFNCDSDVVLVYLSVSFRELQITVLTAAEDAAAAFILVTIIFKGIEIILDLDELHWPD